MKDYSTKEKKEMLRNFIGESFNISGAYKPSSESDRRNLVSSLIDSGRLTPLEGENLLTDLEAKINESEALLETNILKSVSEAVSKIETVSKTIISDLEVKLEKLELRYDKVRKDKQH
ncbi:MAG: hypothetical protein ABIA04_03395 [Pseudomonadota bacterium]